MRRQRRCAGQGRSCRVVEALKGGEDGHCMGLTALMECGRCSVPKIMCASF